MPIVDAPPLALRAARHRWAELLRRIFEVDPLTCPRYGAPMRSLAFPTDPAVIHRILAQQARRPPSAWPLTPTPPAAAGP